MRWYILDLRPHEETISIANDDSEIVCRIKNEVNKPQQETVIVMTTTYCECVE